MKGIYRMFNTLDYIEWSGNAISIRDLLKAATELHQLSVERSNSNDDLDPMSLAWEHGFRNCLQGLIQLAIKNSHTDLNVKTSDGKNVHASFLPHTLVVEGETYEKIIGGEEIEVDIDVSQVEELIEKTGQYVSVGDAIRDILRNKLKDIGDPLDPTLCDG